MLYFRSSDIIHLITESVLAEQKGDEPKLKFSFRAR